MCAWDVVGCGVQENRPTMRAGLTGLRSVEIATMEGGGMGTRIRHWSREERRGDEEMQIP